MLQDQYILIIDAILEFIMCGNTQIGAGNFHKHIKKVIKCGPQIASFPGSPSPRTNYTRVTFDLAERLRESLVHFGT